MRNFIIGISALVSLSFLAACGGAGGDGAAGSAGADGSLALPSAGSLALSAVTATNDGTSDSVDTTTTLGTVVRKFTISGADNVSVDGRTMYYVYEGTSATAKSSIWDATLTYTGTNVLYTGAGAQTNGRLDAKIRTQGNDNMTVLTGAVLNDTSGLITHMIMCPGNEAGDAATCASIALNDRGWSPLAQLTDNITELVMPVATSEGFMMIRGNADSSQLHAQSVAVSKGTALSLTGTAGDLIPAGRTPQGTTKGFDVWSNGGTSAYLISIATADTDNYTLTTISSGSTSSVSVDNLTNAIGAAGVRISAGADGIYTTVMSNDNRTISAFKIGSSGAEWIGDNLTTSSTSIAGVGNQVKTRVPMHCSAVNPLGGPMAVAYGHDNMSVMTATLAAGSWSTPAPLDYLRIMSTDNVSVDCDMAFSGLGTVWLVAVGDNGTGVFTYSSTDNGTTWDNMSTALNFSADVDSLSVAIDSQLNLPVVAANVTGGLVALVGLDNSTGSYVWNTYKAEIAIALDATKIELAALSDGTQFMIGHEGVTGGTSGADNASLTVFFDE